MTNSSIIIPDAIMTATLICDYARAIAHDSASDSTLDAMQFDIDCILFRDSLDPDMIEYADYAELTTTADSHISDLESLRAFATAAFNLRP